MTSRDETTGLPRDRDDAARTYRQRRMARLRSGAGGFHKDKRRQTRAEVKRELKGLRDERGN